MRVYCHTHCCVSFSLLFSSSCFFLSVVANKFVEKIKLYMQNCHLNYVRIVHYKWVFLLDKNVWLTGMKHGYFGQFFGQQSISRQTIENSKSSTKMNKTIKIFEKNGNHYQLVRFIVASFCNDTILLYPLYNIFYAYELSKANFYPIFSQVSVSIRAKIAIGLVSHHGCGVFLFFLFCHMHKLRSNYLSKMGIFKWKYPFIMNDAYMV